MERYSQNKVEVAESTLVDVKSQLKTSEASLIRLRDSRNEIEKELQKAVSIETQLKDTECQLVIQRQQVEVFKSRLSASETATSQAEKSLASFRIDHQSTVNKFNDEMTLLTRDKQTVEAQLVKANSEIKQMQESMRSGQNEIARLTAALNQSERSIAIKNEKFARLNAAYNQSIKVLDEKREVNTLLVLVIAELEKKLACETQNEMERQSLATRIVHFESANLDLNKSLTEMKQEYQVNVDRLRLENSCYESSMRELALKLDDAIVGRNEVERLNGVLSEEKNVHRAEMNKSTRLLAEKDAQIKELTLKGSIPIARIQKMFPFNFLFGIVMRLIPSLTNFVLPNFQTC